VSSRTKTNTSCPYCGQVNEVHRGLDGTTPRSGDFSLCWGCRKVGIFGVTGTGFTVRKATAAETEQIMKLPQVRAALAAVAESYTPSEAAQLWAG